MAIGFPAFTERVVRFKGVTRKELARAAEDALDELGWRPYRNGKWFLRATVPMRFHIVFLIWGGRFTVEVEDEELFIRSEGLVAIEWLDLGQHSANIEMFLRQLEDVLDD